MCGIGGIYKLRSSKVEPSYLEWLSKRLLICLSARGTDATGIATINTETQDIRIVKAPVSAIKFVNCEHFKEASFENKNLILLHCRAATQGDPSNNANNHPLVDSETKAVLIHNGVIFNWDKLVKDEALQMTTEVDSEVVLLLYRKYRNIDKVIPKLQGSCAMVLYTKRKVYFYSHLNPLVLAYLPDQEIIVFASTEHILKSSISEPTLITYLDFFVQKKNNTPKHILYTLSTNDLVTLNLKKEKLKVRKLNMDEKVVVFNQYNLQKFIQEDYFEYDRR